MTASINNLFKVYMFSPLGQFGDDECSVGLLDNMLTDLIPGMGYVEDLLDFIEANEFDSLGNWVTIALTTSGTMLFDDEDAGDSEWEEGDMTTSGMQASIFSANLLGMVLGMETTTSEASLTFLFSISTTVIFILIDFSIHGVRYLSILYITPIAMTSAVVLVDLFLISFVYRYYGYSCVPEGTTNLRCQLS